MTTYALPDSERLIGIDLAASAKGAQGTLAHQDRAMAVQDLLDQNSFSVLRAREAGYPGPYRLLLERVENRIVFKFAGEAGDDRGQVLLSLSPLKTKLSEYREICASYNQAIGSANAARIEAVDMARRGLHNEVAELLMERLNGKVDCDRDTARRLVTLIAAMDAPDDK